MMDYGAIEEKWRNEWSRAKIFESEPNDKRPYFVTAAFPYTNAPQHIGHLRTYGTADVLARYKRMQGYNVLYPMAFHGTGTPVLAFAKRIRNNDQELIEELRLFHISDDEIKKMVDPEYIVDYFVKELENGMRTAGLSIDWRRKFVSIEPFFSKFVEWQFGILNKKGLLTQGRHPVGWCPNENNAVGMHDTKHDLEPEIEEETAIKFRVEGEDASMLCSTYRPETVYGVTNVFVDQNAQYALCRIENENCYLSKQASQILNYQMQIRVLKEVSGSELLSKKCVNPVNNEVIPVLPGFFVKEKIGTGIVMSVPAHAPFDYAALERLRASGYRMPEIKPRKIIDVQIGRSLSDVSVGEAKPEHVDVPALAYLEVLHTDANAIDDMLEFATKLQYREESHWGRMLVKGYEGMSEPEARDRIKSRLLDENKAMRLYVIQNAPVSCRCGYEVVVKIVDNQWFLNYGDAEWKRSVRSAFSGVRVLPDKARNGFAAAIDWIDLRAVARAQGLGTKFPLDRNFIIESLSDSTMYMSFYTVSHLIRGVGVEKLKPEFFDFVFLGKGDAEDVARSTGMDYDVVKKCRESFDYWYTDTSRHSGADLIFNHLTMYLFNHVAIFEKERWPKQIVVNGFVLCEGEKMSKSLGNLVPLVDGIKESGADPLRIAEITGSDLFSDSEYSRSAVNGVKERLGYLDGIVDGVDEHESGELKQIDYWLYSKLNRKIERITSAMEVLELRDVATELLYNSVIELRRYFERGGSNGIVLREFVQDVVLMLQPIAPHVSEELWHRLGNTTFSSLEKWPSANKEVLNEKVEKEEEFIDLVFEDSKKALALITMKSGGKKLSRMVLIVASDWKREATNLLSKTKNPSEVIDRVRSEGKATPEAIAKYVGRLSKDIGRLGEVGMCEDEECAVLDEARVYLSKSLGVEVVVEKEEASKSPRAERALPLKPSIELV